MPPIPVTIITGFLGAGKTTLLLNLLPQLPAGYKLALLKNEFGDVQVDSQLAASSSIAGVRELLNGCICCNLVGQVGEALVELRERVAPDRIVIESSGNAFPAGLAMEVNRLARQDTGGARGFVLDGVVSVVDVENWEGYGDASVAARMQARYTDLVVFNKHEGVGEEVFERALDRLGDLEVQTAWVKSVRGWVDRDVVLGIDGAMVAREGVREAVESDEHVGRVGHGHEEHHQSEVEVLSVVLEAEGGSAGVDLDAFEDLLLAAPKDEVYRIKGLVMTSKTPPDSTGDRKGSLGIGTGKGLYVLNWAFSRWTYTQLQSSGLAVMEGAVTRLTFILARGESNKWKKKLEGGGLIKLEKGSGTGKLRVEKVG